MASFVRVAGSLFLKSFSLFEILGGIFLGVRSRSLAAISRFASSFNILITEGSIFFWLDAVFSTSILFSSMNLPSGAFNFSSLVFFVRA